MKTVESVNLPFVPIVNEPKVQAPSQQPKQKTHNLDFQQILETEFRKLKFSGHAKARLSSRNLEITPEEFQKLDKAMELSEQKGGRESLIIFPDKAFLVSVINRTVITVFPNNDMETKVITNIDSVVLNV